MAQKTRLSQTQRIKKRLSTFFEDKIYTETDVESGLESGDIFHKPSDMLPFLQTALMDEKFIEVEMNGITQIYFSRIHDHPPESDTDVELIDHTSEYSKGDYLKEYTHIITLPLEPGMGNYNIRYSNRLLLRFFTTTYAVELGTFFQEQTVVHSLPVLRLDYPTVGRIVRGSREYRAKVPQKMDIELLIVGKRKKKSFTTKLINVSISGFAFSITKEQQAHFFVDEQRTIEITINGEKHVRLNGKVRHIFKIRGKSGTEFMCGIQADLVTRAIASKLEEVVAAVQRAHLRELAELSRESGIELIK